MNFLFICNKIPYPANDGGSIATLNMIRGIRNHGHEVVVLAMRTLKHNFNIKDIPDEIQKEIKFHSVDVDAGTSVFAALKNYFFSKLPYNAKRFINKSFSDELAKLLSCNNFDIIQLEGIYLAPYISIIRKHSTAKISLRAHNIEHEIWMRVAEGEKSSFKKIYIKNLSKRIRKFELSYINKYDFLIPITERDRKQFDLFGNNKPTYTAQAGMEFLDITNEGSSNNSLDLFHIGSLDWAPNQEGLVWFFNEVWPLVIKEYQDLKIFVAGRNAPKWLEAFFRKQKNVIYLGEIDDAKEFIKSKSIMIVPLKSGSGMRIKIVEGMSLGKVIITTTIGMEGIDAEHGKNIFVANEPLDFLNEIKNIIHNPELINRVGKNAAMFIYDNFDNSKITKGLLDFFSKNLN
ncbi:MAG: glycosyltransferase family 4 protein [Bacteroidota bacterium]